VIIHHPEVTIPTFFKIDKTLLALELPTNVMKHTTHEWGGQPNLGNAWILGTYGTALPPL